MDIKRLPVKITDIDKYGDTCLDIGGEPACLIEPKPSLVSLGLVYLNRIKLDDPSWENIICANLGGRDFKGCTDDPRIVEIAKKQIQGKLTKADIGTVYPPIEISDD